MIMRTIVFLIGMLTALSTLAGGYEIGDKVSNFKLKNIDGNMVALNELDDVKGAIIIFTCNHCPYSVANEDRIIALDKQYKKKGYPVIAINPNDPEIQPEDSFDKMKERAAEKNFTFPYLFDEQQTVYKEFGAKKTPHVFVLNKQDNQFVLQYIGAIDDSPRKPGKVEEKYVEKVVDALLSGKEPPFRETKAIGCSIKD